MDHKNKKQPGLRKKKIFPAVCDYLRSFNPYPDRNFNDVYVEFIQKKLNNPSFNTSRLSKWIQGNKSDLLKNPVHIDILIQFIIDTFETKNINPESVATEIRAEYQESGDAFYDFVKKHDRLYLNKEYLQYLTNLIRNETSEYNSAFNPKTPSKAVSDPYLKSKPLLRDLVIGISCLLLIGIICYTIFIVISGPKKVVHFEQLPKEGQLIIPKGFYFKIMTNMRGNARQFIKEDIMGDIIEFSSAVARDRAKYLQKDLKDFPSVIWDNSKERYPKGILALKEYPEDNIIENIAKPVILYSKDHIIMFEYSMDE